MKKRICAFLLVCSVLLSSASALTVEGTREILRSYYIDEVPEEILAMDSIEAMLSALGDPYTQYYTQEEYTNFISGLEDIKVVGVGIVVQYLDAGVLVLQTAPDSPAREAGLLPGDYIISVDGKDTRGAPPEVDSWIRGAAGTSVCLTVLRGEETFEVTAVRSAVVFPTVTLDKIENRVGWISCSAFGSTTCQHFYNILSQYEDQVDEWVVDLRSNGGGEIYSAIYSAGLFAGDGAKIYMRSGIGAYHTYQYTAQAAISMGYCDGKRSDFYSDGRLTKKPVIVLTDQNTASGSELFCAIVRDSGVGLLLGERTFGKGVVQSMLRGDQFGLDEGEALKLTTGRLYSSAGATNDKIGILPHLLVNPVLADRIAAMLTAPYDEQGEVLVLRGLGAKNDLTNVRMLSMDVLRDPDNAQATRQLLSALPNTVSVQLLHQGALTDLTVNQVAERCRVSLAPRAAFSDMNDGEFVQAITTLAGYEIINGTGDGTFRPNVSLDRASLCALLVRAMRYPVRNTDRIVFADVTPEDWYAPYVNAMYDVGLVSGYGDGYFHPHDPVTHEQFLTILGRAIKWLDMDYYELSRRNGIYGEIMPNDTELAKAYDGYAEWAREMIWLCDDALFWAPLDEIDPAAPTQRDEAAEALYRLLCESGVLSE